MLRFLTYVAVASVFFSIYQIGSKEIASLGSGSSNAVSGAVPRSQPTKTGGQVAASEASGTPLSPARRSGGSRAKVILFTGTQWCPPCRQLESKVINTMPWREFTRTEVSFQKIDLPRDSALIRSGDRELLAKYGIQSFPTLIVVDARGHEHGRRSGSSNNPQEVVNWARGIAARL